MIRDDGADARFLSRRAALFGGMALGLPLLTGLPAWAQGPSSVVDITQARTDPIPIAMPDFAGGRRMRSASAATSPAWS